MTNSWLRLEFWPPSWKWVTRNIFMSRICFSDPETLDLTHHLRITDIYNQIYDSSCFLVAILDFGGALGKSVLMRWVPQIKSKDRSKGNSMQNLEKLSTLWTGWRAWLSGRTSVSGQRSFAVLRSTCSWQVTTYVGKPSAIGQPTRPTQPFILSGR